MSELLRMASGALLLPLVAALALLFEGVDRLVHARLQRRIGPPLWQPFLDLGKLLVKESVVPRTAVAPIFQWAPAVALASTLTVFLYVPMGSIPSVLAFRGDLVLIIYLLTLSATALVVGGFASGSPWASVGAQREMVLMMSYELPLALVACSLAWLVNAKGFPGAAFTLESFVASNPWAIAGWTGRFGIFALMLGMLAVVPAEVGKVPMDIAEAKTEILEGLIAEYSGRNLAMVKLTFALRTLALSCVVVNLFLPFSVGEMVGLEGAGAAIFDFVAFWLKVLLVQSLGVTLVRSAFGRFKIWQASWAYWVPVALISLAGMVLVGIDGIM